MKKLKKLYEQLTDGNVSNPIYVDMVWREALEKEGIKYFPIEAYEE